MGSRSLLRGWFTGPAALGQAASQPACQGGPAPGPFAPTINSPSRRAVAAANPARRGRTGRQNLPAVPKPLFPDRRKDLKLKSFAGSIAAAKLASGLHIHGHNNPLPPWAFAADVPPHPPNARRDGNIAGDTE